jgi:Arc/MetJ-type ribon-helix-helix transcriptional regulator
MNVVLSPATAKLLEEHMKRGGYASADDAVRLALETLGQVEGEAIEDLDSETLAAIERAEAQGDRGEGMPVDVAFERLRHKHFGE